MIIKRIERLGDIGSYKFSCTDSNLFSTGASAQGSLFLTGQASIKLDVQDIMPYYYIF